jgi:hypothetical protein
MLRRACLVVLTLLSACAHNAPPPEPVGPGGPLRVRYPPESVHIEGPMTQDVAVNTLDANRQAFASCVPPGALAHSGRLVVGLTLQVGPDGRVRKAVLTGSNTSDRAIERCMVHRAQHIQFPNGTAPTPSVAKTMVEISNP